MNFQSNPIQPDGSNRLKPVRVVKIGGSLLQDGEGSSVRQSIASEGENAASEGQPSEFETCNLQSLEAVSKPKVGPVPTGRTTRKIGRWEPALHRQSVLKRLLVSQTLQFRIREWLSLQPPMHTLWIVGGGEAVEQVRRSSGSNVRSDEELHWLCIELMDANSQWLKESFPTWAIVSEPESAKEICGRGEAANCIFLSSQWLKANPQLTPKSWDVTSDSIAAVVAAEVCATELVLLKSCPAKEDGVKENGIIEKGIIENGVNEKGVNEKGVNENGVNENGVKANGIIENGVNENGVKENDIKENDIKENDIKENDIKALSDSGYVDKYFSTAVAKCAPGMKCRFVNFRHREFREN